MNDRLDAAFLRGLTQRRFSRRDLLRITGLGAATIAVAAACQSKASGPTVRFANWPLYMDPEQPELKAFTEETGINVEYSEVIEDMGPWFAKVQPQLAAGQSIGYDLMVITNGLQFKQFVKGNFLKRLDHSALPTFTANVDPKYTTSSYDPGNVYSVPWASGMTGIAYDPDKVDGPITSLADLWDPKYAGKVGMPSDTQEIANFGLLALGISPEDATPEDWAAAAAKLQQQKDAGIVRNYYDQAYIDALAQGEVWVTWAWSGDIFQRNVSDGSNFQFVIPEEGGTIWTDNMTIPSTAQNPDDALKLIDFFYRPEIAATLAEYINYVTPVPAAKAIISQHASEAENEEDKEFLQEVVDSPLVFPDSATLAKLHYYVDFETDALQQQFQSLFEPIVLS